MTITGSQLRIAHKNPCRVGTTATVTLVGGAPSIVDDVSLSAGDRVFVWQQAAGADNGIYTVSVVGSGSNGTWVRATDFDETDNDRITAGLRVYIQEGSTLGGKSYKLATTGAIVLDTTSLTFSDVTYDPVAQTQLVYVSKAGNESNSGLNVNLPKLTIGSAITAAIALSPTSADRVEIRILGGGTWTENPSLPSNVGLHGPEAILSGYFPSIGSGCRVVLQQVSHSAATLFNLNTSGERWITVEYAETSTGTVVLVNHATAVVTVDIGYVVQLGVGVPVGVNAGVLLGHIGRIYQAEAAVVISISGTGVAYLDIGRLLDSGAGIGISHSAPTTVHINVLKLDCNTTYTVSDASGVLNMFVNDLVGTTGTITGTANVVVAGTYGNVVGPSSSIDNSLPRFNLATGKLLQGGAASSNVILDDTGNLYPQVNDGGSLGTNSLGWADLFLADGGVAYFGNDTGLHNKIWQSTGAPSGRLEMKAEDRFQWYLENADHVSDKRVMIFSAGTPSLLQVGGISGNEVDLIVGGDVYPDVTNSRSLGTSTKAWSDLFLGSGGVIDFNNGNMTVTHSAETLTVASGSNDVTLALRDSTTYLETNGSGKLNVRATALGLYGTGGINAYMTSGNFKVYTTNTDFQVYSGLAATYPVFDVDTSLYTVQIAAALNTNSYLRMTEYNDTYFGGYISYQGNGNRLLFGTNASQLAGSYTNDVVTMNIPRAGGKVGIIGAAARNASAWLTSFDPGYALEVRDSVNAAISAIKNLSTGTSANILRLEFTNLDPVVGAGNYWLECYRSTGRLGGLRGNGDATTVIFQGFSASHHSQVLNSTLTDGAFNDGSQDWEIGMILSSTGTMMGDGDGIITEEPQCALASTERDKTVIGLFRGANDEQDIQAGANDTLPLVLYASLGHGKVLVTDKGGNVDNGDLVTTSTVPGYGQIQSDDIIHSYTVCKVTEQIVWADVTDTVNEGEDTHKYALLCCFVYSG